MTNESKLENDGKKKHSTKNENVPLRNLIRLELHSFFFGSTVFVDLELTTKNKRYFIPDVGLVPKQQKNIGNHEKNKSFGPKHISLIKHASSFVYPHLTPHVMRLNVRL